MSDEKSTVVDFVSRGDSPDEWRVVLVEEGPWRDSIEEQLGRIQARLYDSIDAILDGQLAEKFPESKGKRVILQLDCYNVPALEVDQFFQRFSSQVFLLDDYRRALQGNPFVREIKLQIQFENIH
ncbi:DUF6572 domain-containing protein [Frateuria sp.]|uniref:DUF6572 domain-containing protein n=1 Tax=Frateuria sp. TaxID=2211372 RepID=UPI00183B28AD|nr:DUF6572 domain-containing protein [Frateuria sp.]NUR23290.1 hypothetical protein [Frateuria sp.]